ncbi:MAG: class I SAM-dependent methyltransferase [Syntrophaceae bacterium]|nr:class I SAM-dependent methyltransferase [Syntrophaceae bacterium]
MEWVNNVDKASQLLDIGCGYGRITFDLYKEGFKNIIGFDTSKPLIERAVYENPGPLYTTDKQTFENIHFGLVICFALFTSCPTEEGQSELKKLINKHTMTGAYLYISDCITTDNPHYNERYEQRKLNIYGCFSSSELSIFRHHEPTHFDDLFLNWTKIKERKVDGKTLNGNNIRISQYLYKKS